MLFVILVTSVFGYAPAAVWMLDHGGVGKLWLMFSLALLAVLGLGVALALVYNVRETTRLLLYVGVLAGSAFLCTTALLHIAHALRCGQSLRAVAAFSGGIVGLIGGLFVAVYGLRSW